MHTFPQASFSSSDLRTVSESDAATVIVAADHFFTDDQLQTWHVKQQDVGLRTPRSLVLLAADIAIAYPSPKTSSQYQPPAHQMDNVSTYPRKPPNDILVPIVLSAADVAVA